MTIPKPKSDELIDRIHALLWSGSCDQMEIARIQREAEKLKKVPGMASDGYQVLGMVHALKFKTQEVDKNFNAAIAANPAERKTLMHNWVTSLSRSLDPDRAMEVLKNLVNRFSDDLDVLDFAVEISFSSCNFFAAFDFSEKFNLLSSARKISTDELNSFLAHMKSLGLSDSDVSNRLKVAIGVLVEKKIYPIKHSFLFYDGCMRFVWGAPVDIETALDVSFSIADKIASSFDDTLMELITFSCEPGQL